MIVVALAPVEVLQRCVDGDSQCEDGKQSLKALSHPGKPRPNSPRSRQADRYSRDCRQQKRVRRRARLGRLSALTIRRRLNWTKSDPSLGR